MEELPPTLLEHIPADARPAALAWWAGLTPAGRSEIADLYDERCDGFFGPAADDAPAVHGGRFLADDDAWRFGAWERDWREYLTEHSDVFLAAMFRSRCVRDGDGSLCIVADWALTRFRGSERPPSEQGQTEFGAAPGHG